MAEKDYTPDEINIKSLAVSELLKHINSGAITRLPPEYIANHNNLIESAQEQLKQEGVGFSAEQPVRMYVVNGSQGKSMAVDVLPEGGLIILISSDLHKPTSKYVYDTQYDNIALIDRAGGEYLKPAEKELSESFRKEYAKLAKANGLSQPPRIYISKQLSKQTTALAEVGQTKLGEPYVKVNEAFINGNTDELLAVLQHEITHFTKGHTTPAGVVRKQINIGALAAMENEADEGLKKLCDPSLVVGVLKRTEGYNLEEIKKQNPHLSADEIQKQADELSKNHGLGGINTRIATINMMPKNSDGCFDIKPDPTPVRKLPAPARGQSTP